MLRQGTFALLLLACASAEPAVPDSAASDAPAVDGPTQTVPPSHLGVNIFDLLIAYQGITPGGRPAAQAALESAHAHGFLHARFFASGFTPHDFSAGDGWMNNPTAFFADFDALLADAKARGMKLVPSLVSLDIFPDLVGEPVGRLLVPGSASRMLLERYVSDVVTRYRDDDTILFWEFGNEWNLMVDLDRTCSGCDGAANGCGTWQSLGQPCHRSSADNIYSCNACRSVSSQQQDLGAFIGDIAGLVKRLDPTRLFSSGYGYMRGNAHHLAASPCPNCDWTSDNPAEYEAAVTQLHPAGVDIVSVHHYFGSDTGRFDPSDVIGRDLLARTVDITARLGRQLYVGEYGEKRAGTYACGSTQESCGGDNNRAATRSLLDGFVAGNVAYSAIWTWEFYEGCPSTPPCYTVTAGEAIVPAMAAHEAAYGACVGRGDGTACAIGTCVQGHCAPTVVTDETLGNASALAGWTTWTNCSGCTQGGIAIAGGALALTAHDLPCTSGCNFPGAYALSPPITVPASGQVLVYLTAGSTAPGAAARLLVFDGQGQAIATGDLVAIASGSVNQVAVLWQPLPAGAARLQVRLEQPTANATLRLERLRAEWSP
jgi:hypothetical protein